MAKKTMHPALMVGIIAILIVMASFWGYRQWQKSGELELQGILQNSIVTLYSEHGGTIASVDVQAGSTVQKGAVAVRFDTQALHAALERERGKLQQLLLLLPPDQIPASAIGSGDGSSSESLSARQDRLRLQEQEFEKIILDVSGKEAQASVYYNRVAIQVAAGKLTEQDRLAALNVVEAARNAVHEAKTNFSSVSLQRAAIGADIQRLKEIRIALGADAIPEQVRIRNYEEQKNLVAELTSAQSASAIVAPENGTVVDVMVQAGMSVPPMHPCLYLKPSGSGVTVRALVDDSLVAGLKAGQESRVVLADYAEPLEGYVSGVTPGLPSAGAQNGSLAAVWITLTPPTQIEQELLMLKDGTKADITVLLRVPLRTLPPTARELPAPVRPVQQEIRKQEKAAQTVVPVVKGMDTSLPGKGEIHTPEATVPSAPSLPPMRAPKKLQGSPYPDPENNPSIARPPLVEKDRFSRP